MKKHKAEYFENLDGLRTLAFLAVFFAHSFYTEVEAYMKEPIWLALRFVGGKGVLGVNFFFVLSGFLITHLLLLEEFQNGKISLLRFYARRILRIWPLFYLVVFGGFVVIPFVMNAMGEVYEEVANILYYIFFINNFDESPSTAVLGVLWSIAIEEQFYLVWPVLLITITRNRYILFIGIVFISFFWRLSGNGGYTDTLTCINDMAIGGLVAYLGMSFPEWKTKLSILPQWFIVLSYILGFSFIFFQAYWNDLGILARSMTRLLLAVFFVFIVFEQSFCRNSFFKMREFKFISKIGKYTYGLYMLHFVAIYVVNKVFEIWIAPSLFHVIVSQTLCSLLLSLFLAFGSFHLLEKPFLKLKSRFSFERS